MKAASRIALLCVLLSGCAAHNMLGREIDIREYPFASGNSYFVGTPRIANSGTLPIAIFIEGDGSQCQRFSESLWRRFLTRYTGDYLLVRPKTRINSVCDTPAFVALDFDHRVDELDTLVKAVRSVFPGRRLYLIGHSAGAQVAIRYSVRAPVDGIIDLSGGVNSLSVLLPEIQRERRRLGKIDDAELNTNSREIDATLARVRADPNSDSPMWGRTTRFCNQMFFSNVDALWLATAVPVLVIHGEKDLESVPSSAVHRAQAAFAAAHRDNVQFVFLPEQGHDTLAPEVFLRVDDWIRAR